MAHNTGGLQDTTRSVDDLKIKITINSKNKNKNNNKSINKKNKNNKNKNDKNKDKRHREVVQCWYNVPHWGPRWKEDEFR